MIEVRCMFCGKKVAEGFEGRIQFTCTRCHCRNSIERDLTGCGILLGGSVGAQYRETREQRNDTWLGSAVK